MRLGESKKPWKLEGCGREKRSNDVLRVVSWLKVLPWMEVLGLCQYGVVSVENGDKERDICGNPKSNEGSSSAERRTRRCSKYIVPGTLVKMRDSKITHNRSSTQISSAISIIPSSTFQQDPSLNQDNGVPCFDHPMYHAQPSCFNRKKLFAVMPVFTPIDTYQF
ncbi:uncharacterized protein HKW66_Vig0179290 [Vigna angularis]|uniref:Uncharacterized protein n=1 Tax=Phaseolus angularis TaxID=3914 RepID=A0A8T0JYA7_PHAAN|nr:uncharacterized protein HKW66_Vig0179290 [Vigna angularis]